MLAGAARRSSQPTRARARTSSTRACSSERRSESTARGRLPLRLAAGLGRAGHGRARQQIVYQSFHLDRLHAGQRQAWATASTATTPRSAASPSTCSTTSIESIPSGKSSIAGSWVCSPTGSRGTACDTRARFSRSRSSASPWRAAPSRARRRRRRRAARSLRQASSGATSSTAAPILARASGHIVGAAILFVFDRSNFRLPTGSPPRP